MAFCRLGGTSPTELHCPDMASSLTSRSTLDSVSPTGMAGSWLHKSLPRPFFSRCLKPHPVRVYSVALDSPAPRLNKHSSRVTQPKSQGGSQAILSSVGLSEQGMHKVQVGITKISIPGCNMNMPGTVIALGRCNRPAIMVYGGTIKMHITRWLEAPCKQLKRRLQCFNVMQLDTASIVEVWRRCLSEMWQSNSEYSGVVLSTSAALIILATFTDAAYAQSKELEVVYDELGADLELGVQVLYLAALLGLIGIASFFVVRQFLFRRELETAAKVLQDRVRTGEALAVEYFELGAIMLRKKFFGLASRYLEQAIEKWDEDPQDLAQVHNALGFSLVNDGKIDKGIAQYEKALKLQPGYVVAWNNLGSAYQKKKDLAKALKAFEQALVFDPNNKVAREYRDSLKPRVERLKGVQLKSD